jgi:hypothetical protein
MMRRFCLSAALVLATMLATSPVAAADVFTEPTLSRARRAAEDSERVVLVYLFERDNSDSSFMEREAWGHPDVRAWVEAYGVAARVDAFSGHGTSLRSTYRIESLPAVLAFRGSDLARQHQGALDGRQLHAWLEVVRVGDVGMADMVLDAAKPERREGVDIDDRLMKALDAPTAAAAAVELLTLWTETVGTAQQEQRRGPVTQALEARVSADLTARERTITARDSAWSRYRKQSQVADLVDWIALNGVLHEDDRTIDWASTARKEDGVRLAKVLSHPQDPLLPMLAEARAWTTIGNAIGDPIALIDARHATYKATKVTITGAESSADRETHHRLWGAVVTGLLASDREREAKAVAEHAVSLDRKAAPVIVDVCVEAGQPRRWQRSMLDPTRKDQVELAMRLTQALEGL